MTTDEPDKTDAWLTVAEIAEELHLNPATIRLWISKGLLPARRAGLRKLLVLRADLDWLLREREGIKTRRQVDALQGHLDQPPELTTTGRVTSDSSAEAPADHERLMEALKALSEADEDLAAARAESENAPPDPGFPHRVRELAFAFMRQSDALTPSEEALLASDVERSILVEDDADGTSLAEKFAQLCERDGAEVLFEQCA